MFEQPYGTVYQSNYLITFTHSWGNLISFSIQTCLWQNVANFWYLYTFPYKFILTRNSRTFPISSFLFAELLFKFGTLISGLCRGWVRSCSPCARASWRRHSRSAGSRRRRPWRWPPRPAIAPGIALCTSGLLASPPERKYYPLVKN